MLVIWSDRVDRVRSVNPPYLQLYSKNAKKTLFMNILRRNLHVMFSGLYFIKLFKKIAASIHDGLDPLAEPPAGLCHGVPRQADHYLLDFGHQGVNIVVGGLINISFTNAPYIIVERIAVRALRGPDLLWLELQEVLPAPILRCLAVVGRHPLLLEHVVVPSSDSVHPGPNHLLQNLEIFLGIDLQPLGEDEDCITLSSLLITPRIITEAGNFIPIKTTSLMSAQSHLLFILFTF